WRDRWSQHALALGVCRQPHGDRPVERYLLGICSAIYLIPYELLRRLDINKGKRVDDIGPFRILDDHQWLGDHCGGRTVVSRGLFRHRPEGAESFGIITEPVKEEVRGRLRIRKGVRLE